MQNIHQIRCLSCKKWMEMGWVFFLGYPKYAIDNDWALNTAGWICKRKTV